MAKEKKKKNTFIRLFVVLLVFALIGAGVYVFLHTKPASSGDEIDERIQTPDYLRSQIGRAHV